MKLRGSTSYTLSLLAGMAIGLALGEWFFSDIDAVFGEPWADIIMGLGGAVLGGLVHEIVVNLARGR